MALFGSARDASLVRSIKKISHTPLMRRDPNIASIENDSPVELQAIGIGHDVTKYYKNALTINRAEELGEVLLEELTKLFKD